MRKSIVRIFLCLVALALANVSMTAQDKPFNVSGSVLDEAGYPVIGAAVLIKGERTGVISDVDGKYKIDVPYSEATLEVSCIGYAPQTIKVAGRQP